MPNIDVLMRHRGTKKVIVYGIPNVSICESDSQHLESGEDGPFGAIKQIHHSNHSIFSLAGSHGLHPDNDKVSLLLRVNPTSGVSIILVGVKNVKLEGNPVAEIEINGASLKLTSN